jgi:hypothetical protein
LLLLLTRHEGVDLVGRSPVLLLGETLALLRRYGSVRKTVAEHREAALRLGLRRFVLKHFLMLGELAVFEADDVSCDPGRWSSVPGETAMCHDIIALG